MEYIGKEGIEPSSPTKEEPETVEPEDGRTDENDKTAESPPPTTEETEEMEQYDMTLPFPIKEDDGNTECMQQGMESPTEEERESAETPDDQTEEKDRTAQSPPPTTEETKAIEQDRMALPSPTKEEDENLESTLEEIEFIIKKENIEPPSLREEGPESVEPEDGQTEGNGNDDDHPPPTTVEITAITAIEHDDKTLPYPTTGDDENPESMQKGKESTEGEEIDPSAPPTEEEPADGHTEEEPADDQTEEKGDTETKAAEEHDMTSPSATQEEDNNIESTQREMESIKKEEIEPSSPPEQEPESVEPEYGQTEKNDSTVKKEKKSKPSSKKKKKKKEGSDDTSSARSSKKKKKKKEGSDDTSSARSSKKKKKKKEGSDDTSSARSPKKKSKKKKKKIKDGSKVKRKVQCASNSALEINSEKLKEEAKQVEKAKRQRDPIGSKVLEDEAFESAWREAETAEVRKPSHLLALDEDSLSCADSILHSVESDGYPPPQQHETIAIFKAEGKARDVRRQTVCLAAEVTRRTSGGRKLSTPAMQFSGVQPSSLRLADSDDGAEQPASASPTRLYTGKDAYIEGVKARSILDEKNRPGAFQIPGTGSADDNDIVTANVTANVADDDDQHIEELVMQRILQETARASVIRVEHGGNSKRYEDPIAEAERRAELEIYKPQGLKEKMFGDGKNTSLDIGAAPDDYIRRRDHLPWTAKLNCTTNLWVASVQTNQKAWESSHYMYEKSSLELKRSIQTFVGSTEQEAYEIGLALAPPLMHALEENPICFLCKTKFALLRRPCNCRNCGVVICSGCACNWSAKQIPATYNMEKRSFVSVCLACDWLANSFQEALLTGEWSRAHSLYQTGNLNLRTLYGARKKCLLGDEALCPIHMAIRGGNLSLIKWLLFDHYCPLYQKRKDGQRAPLLTSKGRSPIDMALEQPRPEILKFLVSNQGLSLMEGAKKDNRNCMSHLMCLIEVIPESMLANIANDTGLPLQEMALSVHSSERSYSFANREHLGSF
jgi:hypothetical protein